MAVCHLWPVLRVCLHIDTMNEMQEVGRQLQQELQQATKQCLADVRAFMQPVEAATRAERDRLVDAEARRFQLYDRLRTLKERAAKIE